MESIYGIIAFVVVVGVAALFWKLGRRSMKRKENFPDVEQSVPGNIPPYEIPKDE